MAKAMLLAWSSAAGADQEDEYNRWYSQVHIPQLRQAMPCIRGVHRYRVAEIGPEATGGRPRYLTAYELDTDDVRTAAAELAAASAAGRFDPTQAMDVTTSPPVLQWLESFDVLTNTEL